MPAKGEIHVRVSSINAGAAARWLTLKCLPRMRMKADTVLTPGYNAEAISSLERLAAILSKAAARKRTDASWFSMNIPRPLVKRFVAASANHPLPLAVAAVLAAMRDASFGPGRGRPRLSEKDVVAHLTGERMHPRASNPKRWPARLKRRERISAASAAWSDEIRGRGETILTTTLPAPKI